MDTQNKAFRRCLSKAPLFNDIIPFMTNDRSINFENCIDLNAVLEEEKAAFEKYAAAKDIECWII